MKATFKVKVLAPETPPVRRETKLTIVLTDATGLTWGFFGATKAEGAALVTVNWGDGTSDAFDGDPVEPSHTYAAPGIYEVTIDDTIAQLQPMDRSIERYVRHLNCVTGFATNAANLTALAGRGFNEDTHLTSVDLRGSGIKTVGSYNFAGCTSLSNVSGFAEVEKLTAYSFMKATGLPDVVAFPSVSKVGSDTGTFTPFPSCSQIREIHFSEKHRASIEACPCYQKDPTLGTKSAVCLFDL